MSKNHEEQFRGFFIPADIIQLISNKQLSIEEAWLLAVVDSFVKSTGKDCFTNNEYLRNRLRLGSTKQVSRIISHLKELGLLVISSSNGRKRHMRASYSRIKVSNNSGGTESTQLVGQNRPAINTVISNTFCAPRGAAEEELENSGRFVRVFKKMWQSAHGTEYTWSGRDGSHAKCIWESPAIGRSRCKARKLLESYFSSTDKFYAGHEIGLLRTRLNCFVAMSAVKVRAANLKISPANLKWAASVVKFLGNDELVSHPVSIPVEDFATLLQTVQDWKDSLPDAIAKIKETSRLNRERLLKAFSDADKWDPQETPISMRYADWIRDEVTQWTKWTGNLEEFYPGKKHFTRFLPTAITGLTTDAEREFLHEAAQSRQ